MDRHAVLDRLKAQAPALRRRYGVASLAVFGSMARGDEREDSDVDVLVAFEGKATFDDFMGLKLDLEDLLGRRVDLLTPKCLSPAMEAEIREEAVLVPGTDAQTDRPSLRVRGRILRRCVGIDMRARPQARQFASTSG
jgi:predicted nucleotidyltransferase